VCRHKEVVESFLEELVVRRELADNFCEWVLSLRKGLATSSPDAAALVAWDRTVRVVVLARRAHCELQL
jgi:hypothetical protein